MTLTSIEVCAGAGGQALGLEAAKFHHLAVVELDDHACATLRANRPYWNTVQDDLNHWDAERYRGKVGLFAGGVPCPPFSKAGKQLGTDDERNLFPAALERVHECQPRAVMLENVRGLLDPVFADYRRAIKSQLEEDGYRAEWRLLQASNFGVPQLRPRSVLVALKEELWEFFQWPSECETPKTPPTVGEALRGQMGDRGWRGLQAWVEGADRIAPTLVGGSHRHGGPDLGPTRAKREWAKLGVNAHVLANEAPSPDFVGMPSLTVAMAATLQGFPLNWRIQGKKTHAYRQVGNAFPPPVAAAVAHRIAEAIRSHRRRAKPSSARRAALAA